MNLGSDIRIKGSFFSHYKTLKLAKLATWEAPIRLQQLWFFASDNRPDGNLTGMDDDDIALASGWMHETRTFVEALLSCGWLDGEPGARHLHDYIEHQPWVQERARKVADGSRGGKKAAEHLTDAEKVERAKRAAAARWSDAESTPSESLDDAKGTKHNAKGTKHNDAKPKPNQTKPIQSNPDQEEEGKAAPSVKADAVKEAKKAINRSIQFDPATFTLSGISEADRAQWAGYAPGCDIDVEIAAFLDYMQTHPEALNRTLETGAWKAALNTWFRNAAKYGAPKAATRKNTGAFASFPASIEREPQRECTEAERLAARKAGEEAYERYRQHRAFHQVGDV